MQVLRRILRVFSSLPSWGVRSVSLITTVFILSVLNTVLANDAEVASPRITGFPPGIESVVSNPTPRTKSDVGVIRQATPAVQLAEPNLAKPINPRSKIPAGFPALDTYAQGLQPKYRKFLTTQAHLTRYDVSIELFPLKRMLKGTAAVALRNNSEDVWSSIVFRLPANLPRLGSQMLVESVVVDGLPVQPVLSPTATVMTLPLDRPLRPGNWIQVELAWDLHYYQLASEEIYVRNGANLDMLNLPHFYPEVAVFAPGARGTNHEGWWTQEIPKHTDIRFHEAMLMTVAVVAPANFVLVGSGTPVQKEPVSDDRLLWQWVTGPVRGFALQASPNYQVSTKTVAGVQVHSYHFAVDEAAALRVLDQTAQALEFFSKAWLPYPYAHMNVVESPLRDTAMEYSNLIQIGVLRYRSEPLNTAFVVTHEVAHQWIYLLVHNDPVHHPGLDEGLAELSFVYMMDAIGHNFNGADYIAWWRRLNQNHESTFDGKTPWNIPSAHQDHAHYYASHYRRPAVALGEIWIEQGDEAFTQRLRSYLARNYLQITTPEHLIDEFRDSLPEEQLGALRDSIGTSTIPIN